MIRSSITIAHTPGNPACPGIQAIPGADSRLHLPQAQPGLQERAAVQVQFSPQRQAGPQAQGFCLAAWVFFVVVVMIILRGSDRPILGTSVFYGDASARA